MNNQSTSSNEAARAGAFIFASLLSSYPDDGFPEAVKPLLADFEINAVLGAIAPGEWPSLREYVQDVATDPEGLRELQSLFIDIFDRGQPRCSLYETEYGPGRAMVKGNELMDVAAFYQAFGFNFGEDGQHRDMVDHLAIELEFYALMLMKVAALAGDGEEEGVAIVADGQKKFLHDHLGRFTNAIAALPRVAGNSFYAAAMNCVDLLVRSECDRLGISPQRVTFENPGMGDDVISCGALGGCNSTSEMPDLSR